MFDYFDLKVSLNEGNKDQLVDRILIEKDIKKNIRRKTSL